jgi:hypothetical protein|tara:strand:+ start:563 stop:733 length:171 start_codon:yes stop_codon:yes gene_type:complete
MQALQRTLQMLADFIMAEISAVIGTANVAELQRGFVASVRPTSSASKILQKSASSM